MSPADLTALSALVARNGAEATLKALAGLLVASAKDADQADDEVTAAGYWEAADLTDQAAYALPELADANG